MSRVPISDRLVQPPSDEALRIARSVSAGTLARIADSQNHLVGWRGRRAARCHFGHRADWAIGLGAGFETPYGKSPRIVYVPWVCSPRSEYVQIIISYQAERAAAGVQIQARLEQISFTGPNPIIDPISGAGWAILWQTQDGSLDSAREHRAQPTALSPAVVEYPAMVTSTGDRVVPSPTAGDLKARCLNIPPGYGGLTIAVALEQQNARLLSADVIELWQEMTDQ